MVLKYSVTLTQHIYYLKACPLNTPTLRPGVNFSLLFESSHNASLY